MKTLIIGDIHGNFNTLNKFIDYHQADIIIQAGDNAYYWNNAAIGQIQPQNTKVYLVPGNHENWDMIEKYVGRHGISPMEVEKNIFICPIGSSIIIDDQVILFVGGADSVDKAYRLPGRSWWPQELLTDYDIEWIKENVLKADIVVSHTCPSYFMLPNFTFDLDSKLKDPTRTQLSKILDHYNIKNWYFGHWHAPMRGIHKNTKWIGLDILYTGSSYFCELGN